MKKFLHVVTGFVLCLLALVVGGAFFYGSGFEPEKLEGLFDTMALHGSYGVMGGGLVFLLAAIYFVSMLGGRRGPQYVSFDTADGSVSISRTAISDFVRKLGDEFSAVVSLDPTVMADRRHCLTLVLNLTVRAGSRVPELSKVLQERVKESLRDDLGFSDVKDVSVKVQKIIGTPVAQPTPEYDV